MADDDGDGDDGCGMVGRWRRQD